MRRNKSVACHCMLPTLGSTAIALLLAAAVMVEIPEQLRYATLPKEWQVALNTFRDKPIARGGARQPFTRDEDSFAFTRLGERRLEASGAPLHRPSQADITRSIMTAV